VDEATAASAAKSTTGPRTRSERIIKAIPGGKLAAQQPCGTVGNMSDKRSRQRVRKRLPVTLGGKLPAIAADVSPGGFHAEMASVFMPGSVVHGVITIKNKEFPFKGEVAWAQAGNPQLSVRSHFGVRFLEIPEEFAEVLPAQQRVRVVE
jgi:hypothetical protein